MATPASPSRGRHAVKEFSKMNRREKQHYLTRVFEKFDKDRSGTIDVEELFRALQFMDIECTKAVCNALIEDMDEDRSGTIDMDEFVQFFERLQSYEAMKQAVANKATQSAIKTKIMGLYLVSIIIFSFTVTLAYVTDPAPSSELMVLFVISTGLVSISFIGIVLMPYVKMMKAKKLAPEQPDEWGNYKKKKPDLRQSKGPVVKAGDDRVHIVVEAAPQDEVAPPADLPESFQETWRLKKAELGELEDGTRLALPRGVANVLGADTLAIDGGNTLPNMIEDGASSRAGSTMTSKMSKSRTQRSRKESAGQDVQRQPLGMSAPVLPPGAPSAQALVQGVTVTTLQTDQFSGDRYRDHVKLGEDRVGKKRAPHFNVWSQRGSPIY